MKEILLLIDSLGSGGAQRQMVTLAKILKQKGHIVSFLLYVNDIFYKEELNELDVNLHIISSNSNISRILKIRKFIRGGNFDVVISFMDTPNLLNNISSIGGKNWKVITLERSSKKEFLLSKKGKIFAWFQRFSDAIVCNSFNAKNMWEKYYPEFGKKLSVIYNAVLIPEINNQYIPKKDGKLHLVVAASYQYLKNPLGLIEAVNLMSDREKGQLIVNWYGNKNVSIGGTTAYNDCLLRIKEYNLEEVIILNSATNDIASKMKSADVVGLFSELEGLPNAICEGMMIGKPILMTRVSDFDILVDSLNGELCDWDDANSIKKSLLSMIEKTENELLNMGRQSYERANRLFSEQKILEQWLDMLNFQTK